MSKSKLRAPGRFRYGFLDPFRIYAPPSYVLVDGAIDLVSFLSDDITYLGTQEDFSRTATRIDPTGDEKKLYRPIPQRARLYSGTGPIFRLIDGGSTDLEEPPPQIAKMRSAAWRKIVTAVDLRRVNFYYFDQTGDLSRTPAKRNWALRRQRGLIQNCGCMWVPSGIPVMSELVVPAFNVSELRRAFDPDLDEEALAKRRQRARAPEMGGVLDQLAIYAVDSDSIIPGDVALRIVRRALDVNNVQLPEDRFSGFLTEFKENNSNAGFCTPGVNRKFFGKEGGNDEAFEEKFLDHYFGEAVGNEEFD